MTCTIYKNIFSKEPYYITVLDALKRIGSGKSKFLVEEIRNTYDKEKAQKIKTNLPSVCFSGIFRADRTDLSIVEHSGFIVLDFDDVDELRDRQTEIISHPFVYACWVSPSGNGLKVLVKIADGKKHREHFQALQEVFPEIDKSGINPSRVCYESYDPDIYVNEKAEIFMKIKVVEKVVTTTTNVNEEKIFSNILKWLSNKNEAFITGERNNFIFKFACACCRFGLSELTVSNYVTNSFLVNSDFSKVESDKAVRSAFKANAARYGTASFDHEILVDKVTRKEIQVDAAIFDESVKPKDVIFGIDIKKESLGIYESGFPFINGIKVPDIDYLFKMKRGEITALSGIGNYGKTTFKHWMQIMRAILYGEKFATFSPEEYPAEEFYHKLVEILLGCDCTPNNPTRPTQDIYERAYDFISQHFFYVYPKDISPTPEYIKERFLELIIKEKVDGVDIDPFNQMANDYGKMGRSDKYLETFLSECSRFAHVNNVYFIIVNHPHKLKKQDDGNYPCPDVYDLADGAMWNNKMDNIIMYHRPYYQTREEDRTCEFYSKKIRRQSSVGKRGSCIFEMSYKTRRFYFNGSDPLQKLINDKNLTFQHRQKEIDFEEKPKGGWSEMDTGSQDLPF